MPFDRTSKREWKDRIKDIVRKHHRQPVISLLARASETYLRAYYNENHYDFAHNGEGYVIRALHQVRGDAPLVIFDVGALHGLWTRAVLAHFPNAEIHCFEIAPETFKVLAGAVSGRPNTHANAIGLSDEDGFLTLNYIPESTSTSTVRKAILATRWNLGSKAIRVPVTTDDRYATSRGVSRIDLLKIDAEGHDLAILKGFDQTLRQLSIPLIQFEHGFTHIPARHLMCDFYEYLGPLGYRLGRLHPNCVEFKDYDLCHDEHFRMGNYVAVHATSEKLIRALSS